MKKASKLSSRYFLEGYPGVIGSKNAERSCEGLSIVRSRKLARGEMPVGSAGIEWLEGRSSNESAPPVKTVKRL